MSSSEQTCRVPTARGRAGLCLAVLLACFWPTWRAGGADLPGSPAALTDLRWLARTPRGERTVIADPLGREKLKAVKSGFVVLDVRGPGVLDHLWTPRYGCVLRFEVDGRLLWRGRFADILQAGDEAKDADELFPAPLCAGAGGQCNLVAPVGFRQSLRIVCDSKTFPRLVSYRTFPDATEVFVADPDPAGAYARGLHEAAAAWRNGGFGFGAKAPADGREVRCDVVLSPGGDAIALDLPGGGEVTRLEFHLSPALVGSLREVVVEFYYDGQPKPALRMTLPDLVGATWPWTNARWVTYTGDLAAGLRYPWTVHTPRFHYPEATFLLNLPIPFAKGLRVRLVNRSPSRKFSGFTRAVVRSLSPADAARTGRLRGMRAVVAMPTARDLRPLLELPGPGQVVGLGIFTVGNSLMPAAAQSGALALTVDDAAPITGGGLIPLWLQGRYAGATGGVPIWNHPLLETGFAGAVRHFVTDPIPFKRRAVLSFTPGPDATGSPEMATVTALWYRFGGGAFAAPEPAAHAQRLPYSTYGASRGEPLGLGEARSRRFWLMEAEDLVPLSTTHACEARAVEDVEHNYHPSGGKYYQLIADKAGAWVDCPVRLPRSTYVAVGTVSIWGPNRGEFEMRLLSKQRAGSPPQFGQGDAFWRGRIVGSVPMETPVFVGGGLYAHRDPHPMFPRPFLNPAPDGEGVLRFICQTRPMNSSTYLMKLDQIRLDRPPATTAGWHEFEDGGAPELSLGLSSRLPRVGRFAWSGWGARMIAVPSEGSATFHFLVPVASARPTAMRVKGCLGPDQGEWRASVSGGPAVALKPGKDDEGVVEWEIPLRDVSLPGRLTVRFECVKVPPPSRQRRRGDRAGELALDAWALK